MTTLELAERLARRVLEDVDGDHVFLATHDELVPDLAANILDELRKHGAWFCRLTEDAQGYTVETPLEQLDLFQCG